MVARRSLNHSRTMMGPINRYALPLMLLTTLWGGCATLESRLPTVGPQSSAIQNCSTQGGLIPVPPRIAFGAQFISVTNVCVSGDTLRATGIDGMALEKPAAGIPRDYQIGEGCVVGGGEFSNLRIFSYKPFTIPGCK